MKKYVFDASVLLRAILDKEEKAARKVKEIFSEVGSKKAEAYSSSFLVLEFANGVRFSLNDSSYALLVWERFAELPINFFSFNQNHLQEILKLSYQLNTTVYDTSYHFLAKLLGGTFVTCDKQYYQKAKKLGDIVFI